MIKKIKENIWQISSKLFGSHVYLIKTKNKNIIIDTGSIYMKKEIIEDLETLDTPPEEINIVLLTHHHFDHIDNFCFCRSGSCSGISDSLYITRYGRRDEQCGSSGYRVWLFSDRTV